MLRLDRNDTSIAMGGDALTICVGPEGAPWSLPAYIAFDEGKRRVLAVGEEARAMRGKEPDGVKVTRFVEQGGFCADLELAEAAVRYALKIKSTGWLVTPRVILIGPEQQKTIAREVCTHAGAREIITIRPAIAAAFGAGLREDESRAVLVIERDWCAFGLLDQWNYVTGFEAAFGMEGLLEEVALHALANRNVFLDLEAAHELFSKAGLGGGGIPGWEMGSHGPKTDRPIASRYTEEDLTQAGALFAARLRWRYLQALASADQARLRGVLSAPLYLFSSYADLPGVRQLLSKALGREVIVPSAGEFSMAVGGRKFLHEILPTLTKQVSVVRK